YYLKDIAGFYIFKKSNIPPSSNKYDKYLRICLLPTCFIYLFISEMTSNMCRSRGSFVAWFV
ncbi:hypothetical protein V1478_008404, partial [Vespula squamosa]